MNHILIGHVNHIETAALATDSALGVRPVSALSTPHGSDYWRTDGDTAAYVAVDAGAAVDWRLVSLHRTNLTPEAEWRIRLGTAAGAGDVFDDGGLVAGGLAPGYGQLVRDLGQDYVARHCRIDLSDPGNPDGFLSVGLGYAGPAWRPAHPFTFGWGTGRTDNSATVTTRGGQAYVFERPRRRVVELSFEGLSEADVYERLLEMDRLRGIAGSVLVLPRPWTAYLAREAIYGTLPALELPRHGSPLRWARPIRIEERL